MPLTEAKVVFSVFVLLIPLRTFAEFRHICSTRRRLERTNIRGILIPVFYQKQPIFYETFTCQIVELVNQFESVFSCDIAHFDTILGEVSLRLLDWLRSFVFHYCILRAI
jgi:hypothetical protein